ncbi:MAG: DUF697 domain-containing protein [Cyanobacteria bacterium P01_A01_bin.17]
MPIANQATDWQTALQDRATQSLQQMIQHHGQLPPELQSELQNQLGVLTGLQNKLSQNLIQIAVFGFVSRGKSAVLNALFAEPIFPVGPLNGETQWPRSVRWSPTLAEIETASLQIELIDTPGLDEIEGQDRAQMAHDIASTADLILFIVAGAPTPEELAALSALRQVQRPILMVVNKADLHPNLRPETVYEKLADLQQVLTPNEILLTAAAPAPVPVRSEWPDGRSKEDWEVPLPNVESLRQCLLKLLNREGRGLLTVNALLQAESIEKEVSQQIAEYCSKSAEALIGKFLVVKGVAIALLPFLFLDLLGCGLFDLLLVGALVRRYGLPTSRYRVDQIWQRLFSNIGSILLTEIVSGILFGLGGDAAIIDNAGNLLPLVSGAVAQAGVAAYGAQRIGQATQTYLVQGATWGPIGPSTLIYQMLQALKPDMLLYRLRQNLTPLPIESGAPN